MGAGAGFEPTTSSLHGCNPHRAFVCKMVGVAGVEPTQLLAPNQAAFQQALTPLAEGRGVEPHARKRTLLSRQVQHRCWVSFHWSALPDQDVPGSCRSDTRYQRCGVPTGSRTPVCWLRTSDPRPLDDRDIARPKGIEPSSLGRQPSRIPDAHDRIVTGRPENPCRATRNDFSLAERRRRSAGRRPWR